MCEAMPRNLFSRWLGNICKWLCWSRDMMSFGNIWHTLRCLHTIDLMSLSSGVAWYT